MGWASGSRVANLIWDGIKDHIPDDLKPVVSTAIIDALREFDWDTLDESRELIKCSPKYYLRELEYLEADDELDAEDAVMLKKLRRMNEENPL